MAGRARSNRLLPLLALVVVVMALYVGFKTLQREGALLQGLMAQLPQPTEADADTPAETIRTLTAKVADMTSQLQALRQENQALLNSREELRQSLQQELMTAWQAEQARRQKPSDDSRLQTLMTQLNELSQRITAIDLKAVQPELPISMGEDSGTTIWVEPLDTALNSEAFSAGSLLQPASQVLTANPVDTPAAIPYYTVPVNATLLGSTSWTALVGRIPINGNVQDPYPFKVIVGADNLAANGISIPEVSGMVFSGTAIGDWNLACVSGDVTAVTFIFTDGTIWTLQSRDTDGERLGWIADEQGIPCISGEIMTNAAAYLTNRIAIGAIEAAAQATAAAETTTSISPFFGTGTASVTGDIDDYVLGKTLAGGAHEVRQWLDERMGQSFDAVFVPAGVRLAINLDQELRIDYDPVGRKTHHVSQQGSVFLRARLD